MPIKILHVIRDLSPTTGGPVTALLGLANAQSKLGLEVSIATTTVENHSNLSENYRIHLFSTHLHKVHWWWYLKKGLDRLVYQTDIVHLHMVWDYPIWVAAKAALRQGKLFILRPCGNLDKWSLSQKAIKKKLYLKFFGDAVRKATAIHFTSEGEWNNALAEAHINNPFVLPIGIHSDAYKNLPSSSTFVGRFPQLEGKRLVLFLGRLHSKKQPDVVINAFKKVCDLDKNLHLVMAGPGQKTYINRLQNIVDRLSLNQRVTFTGMLRGEELQEAYCEAYFFVLPSLQENFGIAVVEAMASSCPVIVSNKVDLSPEIEKAYAGLVCLPDVSSTAEAMKTLLIDESLCNCMGENGRKLVLEKFTWDKISQDLLEVYEDILSGQKRSLSWRS